MNDDPPITNAKQLAQAAADKLPVGAGRAREYWKHITENLEPDTDWTLGKGLVAAMGLEPTTAKQLFEQSENQKELGTLLEQLQNQQMTKAENAQGIELALEIKIREANEKVGEALTKLHKAQEHHKMHEVWLIDQDENVVDFMKAYTLERNELYRKLDMVMPSSLIDELLLKASWAEQDYLVAVDNDGKPEMEMVANYPGMVPKLIEKPREAKDKQLEADFKDAISVLDHDDLMDYFNTRARLSEIHRHKNAVEMEDKASRQTHQKVYAKSLTTLAKCKKDLEDKQEILDKMLQMRAANEAARTRTAQKVPKGYLGMIIDPKKPKTVEVEGTATVGVTATATAHVEAANENDKIASALLTMISEKRDGFEEVKALLAQKGFILSAEKQLVTNEVAFTHKDIIRYKADWLPRGNGGPVLNYDLAQLQERDIIGHQVECICPVERKGKAKKDHARREIALRAGIIVPHSFHLLTIGQDQEKGQNVFDVIHLETNTPLRLALGVDQEGQHQGKLRVRTCMPTLAGWTKKFETSGKVVPADIATNYKYTLDDIVKAHDKLKQALPISPTDVLGITQDNLAA